MSQVSAIAKITAQPGKRDEMIAAFQPMLDHVETEEGTLRYILMKDTGDENVVWFYEQYSDGEALKTHGTSDMMKQVGMSMRDLAAGRPEIMICTPVGGKAAEA